LGKKEAGFHTVGARLSEWKQGWGRNIWVFLQALAALFFDGCVMILELNAIS
jgi:hypothetical protein